MRSAEPRLSRRGNGARAMRYFITFACYGAHLHGDASGSVDRHHNVPGSRLAEANPERVAMKRQQMDQAPYSLDRDRRAMVLDALRGVCLHYGWNLWAAHVRTNHVHAVVEAEVRPEKVMHAFKSYASRNLNRLGIDELDRKRWARHGSTRWLWKDEDVQKAIQYVVSGQGEPMEVHRAEWV